MHVLLTGGAGFIGSHLTEYHLAKGDHVHVVDNLSTGCKENLEQFLDNPNFHFDCADILIWSQLAETISWADRIYHLAAVVGVKKVLEDPVQVMSTNIAGTERVLRAVHRDAWSPEVIITSSSEVYGFNNEPPFNEQTNLIIPSAGRLRWAYAVTKLADEFLGFAYHREHKMDVKVVRLFNTIGPHQTGRYGMVVPSFVRQAVNGEPITVYGDGTQTRSFCDVRDTIVALDLLAGTPGAAGKVVNIGCDREISIKALAKLVKEQARSPSKVEFISYNKAYGVEFEDIQRRRPDLSLLKELTDFQSKWVLEATLDNLITIAVAEKAKHAA